LTFCEKPGMTRRRAATCFGDFANQYDNQFPFTANAASAAVSGHPLTGLGRPRRVSLPEGAFLMALIAQIIFLWEVNWIATDTRAKD
jgi:hypothetical protein